MHAPTATATASPAPAANCFLMRAIPVALLLILLSSAPAEDVPTQATHSSMADVQEVVFAVRPTGPDPHWYANFGRYAPDQMCETPVFPSGASLRALDIKTGEQRILLEDATGGIRDPQVHYDGKKILFSYRPGGTDHYHLYEIAADGSGLRRLTDGPFDDIEPTYLPNDEIVFVSSRCNRWVNCWLTPVANLHRCDADGGNIRSISLNIEHDNTPWPLPDGRLLYTRWEYIDRSQVHYHHLWTANPDGTAPMTWFGNLRPGILMIDSKPVPGSDLVISVFSPGHGQKEHAGPLALVNPKAGPDADSSVRMLTQGNGYRDPWAFSEKSFLAARHNRIVHIDGSGNEQNIFTLTDIETQAGNWCHEPRPLVPRPREAIAIDRTDPESATGTMIVMDTRLGRRMDGVGPHEIKKLLVMESLPKPINYTGGMEPLSYGGTFTLERVLGTVPVEADGSAHFKVPAMRSVFFIALDGRDRAVKRMQSFTGVLPGETLGCIGCHEHRTSAPPSLDSPSPLAVRRPPSRIKPYQNTPDVFDFPRDIQPILDRHCVSCHDTDRADGGVILTGDHGPLYSHSYFSLTVTGQFADGRNRAESNHPPRSLGSGAAAFLKMLDGSHHGVNASAAEQLTARLWIDSGAPYPGTYAALGSGMIGGYQSNQQILHNDSDWPESRAASAVIDRRCTRCHQDQDRPIPRSLCDEIGFSFWMPDLKDRRIRRNRHIVFNLTKPDRSLMLLAPLAKSAGGQGTCSEESQSPGEGTVFTTTEDPDFQAILGMCQAGHRRLGEIKRFDMPGFRPRPEWIREMKRCGVLAEDFDLANDPIDVYATEQSYWEFQQYHPPKANSP